MTELSILTPQEVRAARLLLGWPQERLAARSGTTTVFVLTYENEGRIMKMYSRERSLNGLAAIRAALEAAGVEFTNDHPPSVQLRRSEAP